MQNLQKVLVGLLVVVMNVVVDGQNLCTLSTSSNQTGYNFINNFSTNKCLRVANFGHFADSKIFLDECSWWKTATRDQLFNISSSKLISDGKLLINDAGLDQYYCATMKEGILQTAHCHEASMKIIWRVKPISGQSNQFLIQHVPSSMQCLKPQTRATRSAIVLAPCNSLQTEQIWKLCTYSKNATSV